MDDHRAASVIDDQLKTGSRTITIYAQTASSKGPCKLTPIFRTDWVGGWAETLFLAYESLRPDTLTMVHTRLQEQQVNSQCMVPVCGAASQWTTTLIVVNYQAVATYRLHC